jgi:hypothetical protein
MAQHRALSQKQGDDLCVTLLGQALSKLLGLLSIAKGENYQAKNRKPKTMTF